MKKHCPKYRGKIIRLRRTAEFDTLVGEMEKEFWKKKLVVLILIVAVNSLMAPTSGYATKPCPPSPCLNDANQFDEAAFKAKSDWIAVGSISKVVHRREGPPTDKDFAKFTFRVERWEKGGKTMGDQLNFQVGWCENHKELPADTSGLFRFYGTVQPATVSKGRQYYYFEALKE